MFSTFKLGTDKNYNWLSDPNNEYQIWARFEINTTNLTLQSDYFIASWTKYLI